MEQKSSWLLILLSWLLVGLVLLGACTPDTPKREMELITVRGELVKLSANEGNWLGLTAAEKLADFDYLYQALAENYPYSGVLERKIGLDLTVLYEQTRPKLAETTSDAAFYVMLDKFVEQTQEIGGLSIVTPMDYENLVQSYQNTDDVPPEQREHLKRLAEIYANEQSRFSYGELFRLTQPIMQKVQKHYEQTEPAKADTVEENAPDNVRLNILEQGRIACITVANFDRDYYATDKQTLWDFYRQIADYDHVIFDITNSLGEDKDYVDDLIASPNIIEPLSCSTYWLMKDGAFNRALTGWADYEPIADLPILSHLNREDKAEMAVFRSQVYTVSPLSGDKMLSGRLWLLVGDDTSSAAEYAAMFCKATGLATLVGQRTGGSCIAKEMMPIVLPNSGFIICYNAIYDVTSDGASSQEMGTEPDIYTQEGETTLQACLQAIAQENKKNN